MAGPEHLRRAALGVVAALLLAACGATSAGAPPSGDRSAASTAGPSRASTDLPATPVETFDGDTAALTDYVGTSLVVNFWASWCPPCIAEMPDLEAVHQLTDGQVAFVGVNTQDTPDRAEALAVETGVTYDLVRDPDGALFQAFGGIGMPSTFYVDRDGNIVERHTGLLTREAMLDDLREHLGVDAGPSA